ncbi:carboxypeptidase D-like [Haemaphysalis longicornis]
MMRLGLLTLQVVSGLYALRSDNGTSDLAYHSRQTQLDTVRRLHSAFPSLSRLEDLGKVAGSPVYVLVISRKPRRQFLVPRVYLLADFPAGSELLLKLASQLLHEHEHDDSVARIINGTEVHILFWPQPEVRATPRDDCSADDKGGELAGFPDYFDGKRAHHPSPKAQLVAHWLRGGRFLLGVHVRGGDGGTAMAYGFHNSVRDEDYEAPDEDVLRNLSLSYVQRQPEMKKGANTCPGGRVKGFPDGVTKAAAWHRKAGLVQDYAYVREGTLVLDLALSCCRVPSEKTLRKLWTENRRAILHLLLQAERAVRGYVKADDGTHIPGALLTIRGRNIGFRSTDQGEFWRMLLPGSYTLVVSARGYLPAAVSVSVPKHGHKMEPVVVVLSRHLHQVTIIGLESYTTENSIPAKRHGGDDAALAAGPVPSLLLIACQLFTGAMYMVWPKDAVTLGI